MSEQSMVDRVARALYAKEQERSGGLLDPFGDEGVYRAFMEDARAAIEAMRERTKGMIQVDRFHISPGCAWQAMIDAALNE